MKHIASLAGHAVACVALLLTAPFHAAANDDKNAVITSTDNKGNSYAAKGYVAMKAAPDAKTFKASDKIANAKLPKKVDLRGMMTAIEDQGQTSSCVANALAGSYEYWIRRTTKQDYDVSRLFLYYNARWRSGDQDKDAGSVIQLAMEGLRDFGACSEVSWPFEKPLLLKKPDRDAYAEAAQFKITEMARVPLDLQAWKQALASGYPIVFGCLLFESFDQANQRGGVVPMPSPEDVGRSSHGGHAMTAVGYSDAEQVFIVRNSWGPKWGDKGYCYMPYNYLMNPEFNAGDSWVFVPAVELENPEETWVNDDKPVTDGGRGVTFVINPYSVEDYADVELTWWEESTVEYEETSDDTYLQYAALAEAEEWESMEDFDYEEVIAEWQEENPGEESDLYLVDVEDVYEDEAFEEGMDEAAEGDPEFDEESAADYEEDMEAEGDEGMDEAGYEEYDEEMDASSDESMEDEGGGEEEFYEDEGGDGEESYDDAGGDGEDYEE
ncbi:MAG TPA: C1 family peptidase [Kiritimatiellia bacterium]|nr:C1 family peptidase [Kiritimatiellia bacterium]HMP32818.1 C1 family peptidase [Kiritimatiellia bacterium]